MKPSQGKLEERLRAMMRKLCAIAIMLPATSPLNIGLLCPGYSGHLNPTAAIGGALQRRGHNVTLVSTGNAKAASIAGRAGLNFEAIGVPEHLSGELAAAIQKEGKLRGLRAFRHTVSLFRREEEIILRDLPGVIERQGLDALCIDQLLPAGMGVAEARGVPYGVLCTALPLHLEPAVPPFVTTWKAGDGRLRRFRNRLANQVIKVAAAQLYLQLNRYRVRNGLARYRQCDAQHGGLIQVAQLPDFFDFPRERLPNQFFYSLPWHTERRDIHVPFPWERLDGRPIIYVSLGTVQNGLTSTYRRLAEVCCELDVQVVMALGYEDATLERYNSLPSNVIVVGYAPQLQLLRRAAAVVTHAGMNTALEALSCGLPMVAVPLCNDQPGIAARLARLGVAEVVSPSASPDIMKGAIRRVLNDSAYRKSSRRCQHLIRQGPTMAQTAELIEVGLCRSKPLQRGDPDAGNRTHS